MMQTELLRKTQDEIAKVIAHLPVQKKLQIRAPASPITILKRVLAHSRSFAVIRNANA